MTVQLLICFTYFYQLNLQLGMKAPMKHSGDVRLLFCLLDSSSFHADGMDKKVDKFPVVSAACHKSVELSSVVRCRKYFNLTEGPTWEKDVHWGQTTFLCKSPTSDSPVKWLMVISWGLKKRKWDIDTRQNWGGRKTVITWNGKGSMLWLSVKS